MKMKKFAMVAALTIASVGTAAGTAYADPVAAPAPSPTAAFENNVDLPAAVSGVKDNITTTAAIGGYVGGATGIVTGCVLGGLAAGVVSAPAALLFGAGPLAGCIGGAVLLGSTGALAGTAIGGLGSTAANVGPFTQLLNQPPAAKK
ncbi:hypothetical protein ACNHUS_08170 [Actinomycetes bacterium M1A6_2h]